MASSTAKPLQHPYTGLDGPDPGGLGGGDQGIQEPAAGALAGGGGVDVDRMLDDSGVDASAGHARGAHPAGDLARRGRDEPVTGQTGAGERRPAGRTGLEGRVALIDPGLVDRDRGYQAFTPPALLRPSSVLSGLFFHVLSLSLEASSAGLPRGSRGVGPPDALRHEAPEVSMDDFAASQDRMQSLFHLLAQISRQHGPCSCQPFLEDPAALARAR
jgi:hypothetical protein